jgi:predicted secreted protein
VREFTDTDQINVEIGEPFVVVLPENGPGGYLWRVADLPPSLRVRREDDLAPGEGAPGATGEKVFEFEPTEPGRFTLRFERRRDWEPGADRERTLVVNVAGS